MRSCSPSRYSVSTVSSVRQTILLGGNIQPFRSILPTAFHQVLDVGSERLGDAVKDGNCLVAFTAFDTAQIGLMDLRKVR